MMMNGKMKTVMKEPFVTVRMLEVVVFLLMMSKIRSKMKKLEVGLQAIP